MCGIFLINFLNSICTQNALTGNSGSRAVIDRCSFNNMGSGICLIKQSKCLTMSRASLHSNIPAKEFFRPNVAFNDLSIT